MQIRSRLPLLLLKTERSVVFRESRSCLTVNRDVVDIRAIDLYVEAVKN